MPFACLPLCPCAKAHEVKVRFTLESGHVQRRTHICSSWTVVQYECFSRHINLGCCSRRANSTAKLIGSIRRLENEGMVMIVRQLMAASLLSLALISLPGFAYAQAAGPLAYCKEDAARLCPGVTPGGGKLIGCLKQHENEVSVGCAKELKAVKTKMGK
jgi:hypothetical protein